MAGFMDEFRRELRADYNRDRRNSILFQYLKKERDEGRRNQKNDLYSQLEECFAAADSEEGRRAYFHMVLENLEKSRKPLLPGARGRKDSKDLLLAYALETGDSDLTRAKRWDRKVCKKLLEFLNRDVHFPMPDMDFLRALHEELTDALLLQEAEDYLYNLENGRKNNRDIAILEEYLNAYYTKGSSNSDSALHTFYKKSTAGKGVPIWDDEEKIEELQRFYDALQEEKYSGVLIPIYIDSRTGAGLYFLGRDFLEEVGASKESEKICFIARLYMQQLYLMEEKREYKWEKPRFDWSIWSGEEDELEENCGYPNVDQALRWFKNLIEMTGEGSESPQEYFHEINGDLPPENCPEEYLCYFGVLPKDNQKALGEYGRKEF